jgi:transcriptional regulator with XRE-family HTH domain
MSDMIKKLRSEFKDKEYAHGYMESTCVDRIASQIHTLRKQRNLSQEELSEISGIAQERISKLESADFSSITMKTLNKLSRAFDVNVSIKFEPFSQAITDIVSLNELSLQVPSRDEDLNRPYLVQLQKSSNISPPVATTSSFNEEPKASNVKYVNFLREKDKKSPNSHCGIAQNNIENVLEA